MGRGRCFSQRRKVAKVMARGGWDHELDEWHEKGIGRARAQRSGARYRNRCARRVGPGMARVGDLTETRRHGGFGGGMARGGGPRNDADNHGKGDAVVEFG
jgi:hypothetical protein